MASKNIIAQFFDLFVERAEMTIQVEAISETPEPKPISRPQAMAMYSPGGFYSNAVSISWNGEKSLGEMGPARLYYLDYNMLRLRSWQAYHENEIAQIVINRLTLWMIGKGLKLESNPVMEVLKQERINIGKDSEAFNAAVEARFGLWAGDRMSDYSGMTCMNDHAKTAFKNGKVGGDVLVVLRYIDDCLKVQLIDGAHIQSPTTGIDYLPGKATNGNDIRNGIELNSRNEHVAYYVRNEDYTYTRIEARSASTGLLMVYMVYGDRYRLDNYRGVPKIAVSLQTIKNLDRYKEAMVGSAEERAKIVMTIVHDAISNGENPMITQLVKASGFGEGTEDLPLDVNGKQLADTVAATTNKSVFNMPRGSKMEALESKTELAFKEFYQTNADIICAAMGIPPNVAFSIYNDSFSASRAATKDWEFSMIVERDDFSFQYYQPIYEAYLYIEILKNKIIVPGYLKAFTQDNKMALAAYHNAEFTGPMFPHIDPEKEVNAERLKLGPLGAHLPLTTMEAATRNLNSGDSNANMRQFAKEINVAEGLGLELPETGAMQADESNANEDKTDE